MYKVYKDGVLIGTFDNDTGAAICACNHKRDREDKIEVYGPKSDFIHFELAQNNPYKER